MSHQTSASAPPYPWPVTLGPRFTGNGITFSLHARHADQVWLLLFDAADAEHPTQEIALEPKHHRFGDIWSIHLPDARAGQFYVYRISGTPDGPEPEPFDPDQWILDPYARAIAGSPTWGQARGPKGKVHRNGAYFPKGVLVDDTFDWGDDRRPQIPMKDSVIYETHLRGFTADPSSGVTQPGTYRGLIEKIPYLVELGVTTVELMPIHEFDEMEYYNAGDDRHELRNFWGYSTLGFFAPNGRYAAAGGEGGQVREFKELVKALHAAGLEVILDVVFNHTNEGDQNGPTYSLKGLDPSLYYMRQAAYGYYFNFSGCGNTVNANHPVVQDFIIDCLRYWALEMRVDGFRFDLASILTRGLQGEVLRTHSIVDRIAEDPVIREVKLIAEPWDADGLYQVGSWPRPEWSEWNGKYRDDIRRFWLGHHGLLRTFASRLVGSPDLYSDRKDQAPEKSINFITSHDGFTLHDLVSYSTKHNEANMEKSQDGGNDNWSHNHGEEGPTRDREILSVRLQHMKNLVATLMVSQGIPMILAGDEMGRTQQGNNNAYCQDNDLSWIDWKRLEDYRDLHRFVQQCTAFRKAHPCLRQNRFINAQPQTDRPPDVRWYGNRGGEPHWDESRCVAMLVHGNTDTNRGKLDTADVMVLFNAESHEVEFHLPRPRGNTWRLELHTQTRHPKPRHGGRHVKIRPFSVSILTSNI